MRVLQMVKKPSCWALYFPNFPKPVRLGWTCGLQGAPAPHRWGSEKRCAFALGSRCSLGPWHHVASCGIICIQTAGSQSSTLLFPGGPSRTGNGHSALNGKWTSGYSYAPWYTAHLLWTIIIMVLHFTLANGFSLYHSISSILSQSKVLKASCQFFVASFFLLRLWEFHRTCDPWSLEFGRVPQDTPTASLLQATRTRHPGPGVWSWCDVFHAFDMLWLLWWCLMALNSLKRQDTNQLQEARL